LEKDTMVKRYRLKEPSRRRLLPDHELFLMCLQEIDSARRDQLYFSGMITQRLDGHPECRAGWRAFRDAGGVTAADLRRWLKGLPLDRDRAARIRGHLRLVSKRAPVRMRLVGGSGGGGGEAA
jgi:hypothetical protein